MVAVASFDYKMGRLLDFIYCLRPVQLLFNSQRPNYVLPLIWTLEESEVLKPLLRALCLTRVPSSLSSNASSWIIFSTRDLVSSTCGLFLFLRILKSLVDRVNKYILLYIYKFCSLIVTISLSHTCHVNPDSYIVSLQLYIGHI